MDPIITVDNLSKLYRIGAREKGYKTFREVIIDIVSAPIRNFRRIRDLTHFKESIFQQSGTDTEQSDNVIWALKDVSFEVQPGETIGIIGRNGAGKSTLLKILSRITEPTTGDVKIYGRVSSLLEVGTGFHPELTGRENVFLNGAILGMKKNEIEQKFDEIVSFAEIEKFLDTPVRFYSSGMYVRLAFAVAAHLEPEVLLVDEVLAVGDIEFQKKCLGKMNAVAKAGRTVIFVSHNLDAIKRLCQRTMLLSYGKIIEVGHTEAVIAKYLSNAIRGKSVFQDYVKGLRFGPIFKLHNIDLNQNSAENSESLQFVSSKDIIISFSYEVFEDSSKLFISFALFDTSENRLVESFHNGDDANAVVKKGSYISNAIIPANFLVPISYELKIEFGIWGSYNFTKEPISVLFDIYSDNINNMVYGRRPLGGKVALPIRWDTKII